MKYHVMPFSLATESSLAKRSRLSSYSQAVDRLSKGMPEIGRKGVANIPVPPVQSSSTQHGRATGVKTRSAAKRNVQAMTASSNTANSTKTGVS